MRHFLRPAAVGNGLLVLKRHAFILKTLKFDYLVIATGSSYVVPINQDDFSRSHTEAKLREVILIMPLGPNGGVSQLPMWGGVVVGDWVTWFFKSWDMFATRIWSSMGATVPE